MSPSSRAAATTGTSTTLTRAEARSCCARTVAAGAGSGGEEARELHPGDVVFIPPASSIGMVRRRTAGFSHVAFEAPGEGCSNEWLEPVDGEAYDMLP